MLQAPTECECNESFKNSFNSLLFINVSKLSMRQPRLSMWKIKIIAEHDIQAQATQHVREVMCFDLTKSPNVSVDTKEQLNKHFLGQHHDDGNL